MKRKLINTFLLVFFCSSLYSQVFDTLYLPDSLGGCADLEGFIFNPIMNRIYIWSHRSQIMGVLDCATGERLRPIRNIWHYLPTTSSFVYNPNNNYLYESAYESSPYDPDTNFFVINCSTQVIIDTIKIRLDTFALISFDVNIPVNKIYLTWYKIDRPESTYTNAIDARTNEVIKRFKTLPYIVHHKIRAIAYNYNSGYQANPYSPLYVINCINDSIVDSIPLPVGSEFDKAFIVSEIDSLFVFRRDSLLIIDCSNNTIVGRMQFPVTSFRIDNFAYNSINNKLYVTTQNLYPDEKIYIIDLSTTQIVDSLLRPHDGGRKVLIYNSNTNQLYLLESSSLIEVIDGATNQIIDEIAIPYSPYLNWYFNYFVLNTTLNKLYLNDGLNIFIIDCNQRRLERFFKMSYMNQYMMWQPITNRLYINDVGRDTFSSILTVYDASTNLPLKVLNLSQYLPPYEWFYHFTTATQVNKIYLSSGHSLGIYVLDGNTDSLLNYISCEVGGHYLLYNVNQNKLYTIPFTEFASGYIYIIDCQNDAIRNVIDVGESGNGYFNPYNDRIYATISYEAGDFKVFIIDGIGDTIIKVLDSLGLPLAFRNKENTHQVYIGSVFKDCIYVFDANNDSLIDSVMNVPVVPYDDQFFYYDSIDDRIYYPEGRGVGPGVIVIDCTINQIIDTIVNAGVQPHTFPEEDFWNPISNRYYTHYEGKINVIDCRTNTIITSSPTFYHLTMMQWNSTNNIIYVNQHWRSKILAIKDGLIGITEAKNIRINNELFIYPSIGNKFNIKRKIDEEMLIYDVCGRIVKKIGKKETIIDVKNLSLGVYFIRVNKEKTKNIQKFIIVK